MKLIPPRIFLCFRFCSDINWTDDLSHACPQRYFTPNFTFAFGFVILKVINLEVILFRFALISVSMVHTYIYIYEHPCFATTDCSRDWLQQMGSPVCYLIDVELALQASPKPKDQADHACSNSAS